VRQESVELPSRVIVLETIRGCLGRPRRPVENVYQPVLGGEAHDL
jgi:hypothetical protein